MKYLYTGLIAVCMFFMATVQAQVVRHEFPTANGRVTTIIKLGNTIYIGGSFTSLTYPTTGVTTGRSRLAALDATTGELLPWNPGANGQVSALSAYGNTIYIGGNFTSVDGLSRPYLAAVDATSGAVASWNPTPTGAVSDIVATPSAIYVAGTFVILSNVQHAYNLAKLDPVTGVVIPFPSTDANVYALALLGNSLHAGGNFTSLVQTRYNIGAVNATTGALLSWNPFGTDAGVLELSGIGNTVYAGGSFTGFGYNALSGQTSTHRNRLAAIDATTGAVLPWNPDANSFVTAIAPSGANVYIGGNFTLVGGQARNYLALVDGTTGTPLPSWTPNPDGNVSAIFVDGSTVFVGGNFTSIAGEARSNFAALADEATPAPLPLSLLAFNAECKNNTVQLQWITVNEVNTKGFTIESSANAVNWEAAGFVSAKGNTSQEVYTATIAKSAATLYRLKMEDKDGRFTYSLVRKLDCSSTNTVMVGPSPTRGPVIITFHSLTKDDVLVELTDSKGSRLTSRKFTVAQGLSVERLDLANYPAGTYFIKVIGSNGNIESHKILKD